METPPPVPPKPPSPPPPVPISPPSPARPPATAGKGMSVGIIVLIVGVVGFVGVCIVAIMAAISLPALSNAKQKAQTIHCINNLKVLGLSVRIYATDHDGSYPGGWIQVTNEISRPQLLICPDDGVHVVAPSWTAFGPGNVSYEYLGSGAKEDQTNRVVALCPHHGHIVLADGSVIQARSPKQPVPVARRDGAVWYDGQVP